MREIAPVITSDAEESDANRGVGLIVRLHVIGQTLTLKLVPFVEKAWGLHTIVANQCSGHSSSS